MPQVRQINIYPIKSCRGVAVESAVVGPRGLDGDRRYMLVDAQGNFLSQREHPSMALIRVTPTADGYVVDAPGRPSLALPRELDGARECEVRIWLDTVAAALAGTTVNRWFTDYLGFDCGLVYMTDRHHRAVGNPAAQFEDEVSFADAAPLLLIGEASLAELNSRLAEPVAMRRFRPNLVVSADAPFAEDGWHRIAVGDAEFDVAWPCKRCVLTTVDPETGEKDPAGEPLATLRAFRRVGAGIVFGQNLLPRKLGAVKVGDEIRLFEESN